MPVTTLPMIPTLVALLGTAQPLPSAPPVPEGSPSPGVADRAEPIENAMAPIVAWPPLLGTETTAPATESAPQAVVVRESKPPKTTKSAKSTKRSATTRTKSHTAPRPAAMVAGPELPPDVAAALPFDHVLLASAPMPLGGASDLVAAAAFPVATETEDLPAPSVMPSTAAPVEMPVFPQSESGPMARLWAVFAVALAGFMGLVAWPRTRRALFSNLTDKLRANFPDGNDIQLAADKNLGMGQRVVALEIDGQKVLLGLSQGKMEVLHTWSPEPPAARQSEGAYTQHRPGTRPHAEVLRMPGERVDAPAVRRVTEMGARQPTERRQTTSGVAMPRSQTSAGIATDSVRRQTQARGAIAPGRPQTSAGSLSPSAERLLDVWRQTTASPAKAKTPALGDDSPWWMDGATDDDQRRLTGEQQRLSSRGRPAQPEAESEAEDIEDELQDVLTLRRTANTRAVL